VSPSSSSEHNSYHSKLLSRQVFWEPFGPSSCSGGAVSGRS
jgi:hypothetical protein